MNTPQRVWIYLDRTGRRELTPRQSRRAVKKQRHQVARAHEETALNATEADGDHA